MTPNLSRAAATGFFSLLCGITVAAPADWVSQSDVHAQRVLQNMAKYGPEGAGSFGVEGLDEQIVDLRENLHERQMADAQELTGPGVDVTWEEATSLCLIGV